MSSSATNSNTATVYIGDGDTTGAANTQISTTSTRCLPPH